MITAKERREKLLANLAKAREAKVRKKTAPPEVPVQPVSPKLPEPQSGQNAVLSIITEPDENLFEGAPEIPEVVEVPPTSVFPEPEPAEVLPMRPVDDLPPMDTGLAEDEKREFLALLRKEISLAERARLLAALARLRGQKTAAVGLRAQQEINQLTGLKSDKSTDAAPLFVLPEGTKVAVLVGKVDK